jgi:hypothetical protein
MDRIKVSGTFGKGSIPFGATKKHINVDVLFYLYTFDKTLFFFDQS